jgi:hypothetical protein
MQPLQEVNPEQLARLFIITKKHGEFRTALFRSRDVSFLGLSELGEGMHRS